MVDTTPTENPWIRSLVGTVIDRLIGWYLGLPAETNNYKVQPLRVPIHEGLARVELAADLYEPLISDGAGPLGTVLVRGPYGRGAIMSAIFARIYAARGYRILFVSCRGYFGSGGDFDPCRNEIEDGKAVVEWMRKQEWYTGTFATLGASYLGFTQWALLMDPPVDMVAAIISVGPHDFRDVLWGTGAINMDFITWSGTVSHQNEPYQRLKMLLQPNRFRNVVDGIPFAQTVEAAYKGKADWLQHWIKSPDQEDEYYTPMKLNRALERANIPILLVSGWYDLFSGQTFEQYFRLRERGCKVALTVGNGAHNAAVLNAEAIRDGICWLNEHLAEQIKTPREAPLKYYITGAEEWRYVTDFPPTPASITWYLHGNNKLSMNDRIEDNESSSFIFDPRTPTPTIGGNKLGKDGGKVDDTALAGRPDVLSFTTEPLTSDVEMIGRPTVEFSHATDVPYADLFVRISEVNEKGRSCNISEAYQRLDPKRGSEIITLPLSWCAHRFVKGQRIRLVVAGGSHPHYARNLGVENLDNAGSEMREVTHTIFHGPLKTSRIILPARSI